MKNTMAHSNINWVELQLLVDKLAEPGLGPGSVPEVEWEVIRQSLDRLLADENWKDIIRLRKMFTALFARDTVGGLPLLQSLDEAAIRAARHTDGVAELAHLLGAKGHNLHRQGYHREAIEAFEESAKLYEKIGESFQSLKSYYMTSLCHRALGDRARARRILAQVLQQVKEDDPWRGNPLQVTAWLAQDDGQLDEAERFLTEAVSLQEQSRDPDILVAGTLADLGEVVGLQGRVAEAKEVFERSLAILAKHEGQYDRQEARTRLKLAELLMRQKEYSQAFSLLDQADDKVRGYGHYYDLLWRIELARAFIYLKKGRLGSVVRKLRAVLRYRRELGLSNIMLVRQLWDRLRTGTGLPR
ncbi:MAG: tetratricopeptide repeat protein [Chloroflexota bacterium]|nr:tetratricopeptide repeat protein [Chloroflexota bacterium]